MRTHDDVYESISLIHQIVLPARLVDVMNEYLQERNDFIKLHPEIASSSGCTLDTGPVWVDVRNTRLVPWKKQNVAALMRSVTDLVTSRIGQFPRIGPAHFKLSFQGYYADLGVRNEYRSYISGIVDYWGRMPLRYSHVSAAQALDVHTAACEQLAAMIQAEQLAQGIKPHLPQNSIKAKPSDSSVIDLQMGSWRTIRADVLASILVYLKARIDDDIDIVSSPALDLTQWNATVDWAVVVLALLTGIRPFELVSVDVRHLDLGDGWLSLRGKSRAGTPAFRRIPIFPALVPYLEKVRGTPGSRRSGPFWGHYDDSGVWHPFETSDLDDILRVASQSLHLRESPDFYSLRHRFKTDFMAAGLSEHFLNYLIGHESRGTEAYNIYLDHSMTGLAAAYFDACGRVAMQYGIFADGPYNRSLL
jgi:integrase